MGNIKENIARNITRLRLDHNMTQSELAEKINYTDKSISKWEHAETTPPVEVLKDLSDVFHVSLDYLVSDISDDDYDKIYNAKENKPNKVIITLLAVSVVWMVATICFVYSFIFDITTPWILFVIAVPVSCIVLLVFNCIWGKKRFTYIIESILIWTTLATLYLLFINYNPWILFILGVPLQVAVILWAFLKPNHKTKN